MNRTTLLLVLLGCALRLFIIFPGPFESKVEFLTNKADLRNYYWPAQAALRGENPYALWASGQSGEFRADLAPLELLMYVATVALWNDMRAIQILFALFDAVNIVLLGVLLRQSPLKLPFEIFYALGPLTLYNLVLVPEDKTIVLTLTFLIFWLLLRPSDLEIASRSFDSATKTVAPLRTLAMTKAASPTRATDHGSRITHRALRFTFYALHFTPASLAVLAAALLASFKWLSVFYLLPLLVFVSRDFRGLLKSSALFAIIVALAHLPWIPDWLSVYTFRSARIAAPMHIAPAALLNAAGLFDKNWLLVVLAASLLAIYILFWLRRIDIFEAIALSTAAGILWTPDMDPVHLAIIVLSFLLIVDWSRRARLVTVWGLSAWVALVYAISTRTGLTRYGLPDLRAITGAYGSPQMIALAYVLFGAVFAFYLFDKWRGRVVGKRVLVAGTEDGC